MNQTYFDCNGNLRICNKFLEWFCGENNHYVANGSKTLAKQK
jgi:hypothetical protein